MTAPGTGSVRVRPVRPDDRAAWLAMRVALWPDDEAVHVAEIDAFYAGKGFGVGSLDAAVLLAEDARGDAAGFLELSLRPWAEGCEGPTPYVEGWFVREHARGRGVGRALMEAAEGWARARGHAALASDTELHNVVSQRAHAALGFEVVERLVLLRKAL